MVRTLPKITVYIVMCKECATVKQVTLTGSTSDYYDTCEVCRALSLHRVVEERK
jgi:predicted nucleic acid-binding Zn ribbon protein